MRDRAVALLVLSASGAYLVLALGLPLGTAGRPGPAFFPVFIGVFLLVVASALTVAAFLRARPTVRDTAPSSPPATTASRAPTPPMRAAVTAATLVGFCAVLPWAGYPLAAFGFVAVLLRWLGNARWPGALTTAVLTTALSYYLFAVLLAVPLPRGAFLD